MPIKTIILEGSNGLGKFRWSWPRRDGAYCYKAYRRPSHLEMLRKIKEEGFARCYYVRNGCKVSFSVVGLGIFSRLRLADFLFETNSKTKAPGKASSPQNGTFIPETPDAPLIRTDFADDAAWESLLQRLREPVGKMEFLANFTPVSEPSFSGAPPKTLLDAVPAGSPHRILLVSDTHTMTDPRHPVLVVELHGAGRTFRAEPGSVQSIENNLTIANMDWDEFAERIDAEGVFIPFD